MARRSRTAAATAATVVNSSSSSGRGSPLTVKADTNGRIWSPIRSKVDAKHKPEIDAETARLKAVIDAAKKTRDADGRKAAQAELRQYEKRMAGTKAREARQLLKQRFDYPIFLYDAEHVGITATGEQETCELYHDQKLGLPAGITAAETALERYRRFRQSPETFVLMEAGE